MAILHCVMSSPEGKVFDGDVKSVIVPAVDGELGILPRHAPLIARLGQGELRLKPARYVQGETDTARYFVEGGFVQVLSNRVNILVAAAESLEALARSDAEAGVEAILRGRPPEFGSFEERDAYEARLRQAKLRARLAGA